MKGRGEGTDEEQLYGYGKAGRIAASIQALITN